MTGNTIFDQAVIDAINRNQKVTAIKLLREATGMGLKDAKDLVEQYCAQGRVAEPVGGVSAGQSGLISEPAVLEAINRGRKIEAIKLLRQARGIGLKEAKELVEQYGGTNSVSVQPFGESKFFSYIALVIVVGLIAYFGYKFLN